MRKTAIILASILMVSLIAIPALADGSATIGGGKHDFTDTATNTGRTYTGLDESTNAACAACHVPHNASTNTLLFTDSNADYGDDTATFNNGGGAFTTDTTQMCMSCHDGTFSGAVGDGTAMTSNGNLGTSLADDHPVDVPYPDPATSNAGLADPTTLPAKTDITAANDTLSCGGCHDPHNNNTTTGGETRMFLIEDPASTDICLVCHSAK